MKFYSEVIFPRLLDVAMSGSSMTEHRRSLLSEAQGDILEIGIGTGLNLPHYPNSVKQLTTVDVNPGMQPITLKRAEQAGIAIKHHVVSGEALPMPDNQFDYVVSTWTLCSIPNVAQAIGEIYRVLKPGGKFLVIEHGLSHEANIQVWQNRLTPIQKIFGDGCHINRDMQALVSERFQNSKIETFYAKGLPKIEGYFYKGSATKAA